MLHDVLQCRGAEAKLHAAVGKARARRAVLVHAREHGEARPMQAAQLEQRIGGAMRAEREHAVALRVRAHDVERARTEGAGSAEHREVHATSGHASAARGRTAVALSIRSRMPPCPARREPLSFSPAWRFAADSNRSPIMLTMPSNIAVATRAGAAPR